MRIERHRVTSFKYIFLLAIGFAACLSGFAAQAREACVTASVPDSFTLPDGSVHAAGRLTVCVIQKLSPVVGLHRAWVEGDGTSLVMSRIATAEEKPDSLPAIVFRHIAGSPLELLGYEASSGRQAWSYALIRWDRDGKVGTGTIATEAPAQ